LDAYGSTNMVKLYQAYYEQRFGATDVLVGKYDVQTQFATTRPMELFGNKGQAMNMAFMLMGAASGFNGASTYPNSAVGLRVKQTLNDQWSLKLGVLDGMADRPNGATGILIKDTYGALGIGEVDFTPAAHTKLMAGVWGDTGKFNKLGQFTSTFAPIKTWGTTGEYVGGATRLYTIEGARGVDGFVNVGFADEATSIFNHSLNAGVTVTGLIDARPTDKLGFAVAVGENSPGFRKVMLLTGHSIAKYETAYEATYRAKLTSWLVVQPEVEYIVNPAGGGKKNAFVFGLHFELRGEFH
jgi:porin